MPCTPKLKNTCGVVSFATCTYYEDSVPVFSSLINEDCYTVEEVIVDTYQILTSIKSELDLVDLLNNGIEYVLVDGKVLTNNALSKHAEEIIALKKSVSDILTGYDGNMDITSWGLDTSCLVDACGDDITTLKQVLDSLITKVCTLTNSENK